jgi:DNA-binding beta-propeller fold protein YncE
MTLTRRATAVLLASAALATLTAQTPVVPPRLDVDPFWPTMPETFFLGPVRGLSVDAQDHVWIVHDPAAITADIRGAAADPPQAECCVPAPQVLEFDPSGKYVQGWSMTGEGYEALQQVHGIFVDHRSNVWISSERQGDNHILKFDRRGKFLLQIGRKGQSQGSNDTANVNRAADMFVWPKTNELFVADGYGNRRVIVFDAETGAYKRHWGAYGARPDDSDKTPRTSSGEGSKQFNLVHDVLISRDELLYVADRSNNRLQVFRPDGTFVNEAYIARTTATTNGTVYAFALSADAQQRFLYVADAANGRIRVLDRKSLTVIDSIGRWGRQAGQFMVPHSIATDSNGNLYVAEIREGRVQKFVSRSPNRR